MKNPRDDADAIVQVGAPVLRGQAQAVPVDAIRSKRIQKVLAHMEEVLAREPHGAALAAVQVGEPLRIFIISKRVFSGTSEAQDDASRAEEHFVFINPVLLKKSRKKNELDEGCLSVRGKYGVVKRHAQATVKAYDEQGRTFIRGASGLLAQAFQHELDHLDGILFIDKAEKVWEENKDERENK